MIYRLVKRDRLRAVAKSLVSGVPYFTEKTSLKRSKNTVAFIVDKKITKLDIQESFKRENDGVKVEVNTLVRKGKVKRVRGVKGKRKDVKIAFVRFPADFQLPNLHGEAEV
jgi:large subunit ribosomal protein L23